MEILHRQIQFAIALCCAALVAGLAAYLALVDIYHGEADSTLEWRALQVAAPIVAAAVLIALRTLVKVVAITRHPSRAAPPTER